MPLVLIVWHSATGGAQALAEALGEGASDDSIGGVEVVSRRALEAGVEDVLAADGMLLCTPENFGYMSGALKDFFDRTYYPVLEEKQGLAYMLIIRAGHDGTGTRRGVETIITGLRWKAVQEPLICRGDFDEAFVGQCEEAGMLMAAGLDAGIF